MAKSKLPKQKIYQADTILYWLLSGRVGTPNDFFKIFGVGTSSSPSRISYHNKASRLDKLIQLQRIYYDGRNKTVIRNTFYSIPDETKRNETIAKLNLDIHTMEALIRKRIEDHHEDDYLKKQALMTLRQSEYKASDINEYIAKQTRYPGLRLTRHKELPIVKSAMDRIKEACQR